MDLGVVEFSQHRGRMRRIRARAFSGEVETGSPKKMR
jgi:hypothetical protein